MSGSELGSWSNRSMPVPLRHQRLRLVNEPFASGCGTSGRAALCRGTAAPDAVPAAHVIRPRRHGRRRTAAAGDRCIRRNSVPLHLASNRQRIPNFLRIVAVLVIAHLCVNFLLEADDRRRQGVDSEPCKFIRNPLDRTRAQSCIWAAVWISPCGLSPATAGAAKVLSVTA